MDVVRTFNNELSSLYEVKPPISKAKMTQITKSAIKGIKFYKHIVQSVEKFIQKCRPEYKVPGLYVVDSIVRQSRHQFGADKDVFAPRFAKNITATFINLFKCGEEDRARIVRVLNLWQKNTVFTSDVVQPLMDMANPNSAIASPVQTSVAELIHNSKSKTVEASSWKGWPQNEEPPQEDSHSFPEMTAKNLEKFAKANYSTTATENNAPMPEIKAVHHKSAEVIPDENAVKFNQKLLDFDYGDEEDEEEVKTDDNQMPNRPNPLALSMAQEFLSNPNLLQLFQMQNVRNETQNPETELPPHMQQETENKQCYSPEPPENHMSVGAIPYPEQHQSHMIPFAYDPNLLPYAPPHPPPPMQFPDPKPMEPIYPHPMILEEPMLPSQTDEDERVIYSMPGEPPLPPQDLDERAIILPSVDEHLRKERSRSRSESRSRRKGGRHRSKSRSPRRRKSRSRSRSRSRRNRSRSRERRRARQRDREREKQRKGIPPVRKNFISVCTTTLWLGHVPKSFSEVDITKMFENFGSISSVDMIPPRGCAYVVMERRQDAHHALQKLKDVKVKGSTIKIAWAPGKGVKGREFKEYWETEAGVSYIPYEKVSQKDLQVLDNLEEGAFIDEESLPQSLKDLRVQRSSNGTRSEEKLDKVPELMIPQVTSGPPTMMPNTTMGMSMVLPQMMQQQFGMPMPGMMPPQSMMVQMPLSVPPPNPLMMVQPPSQTILAGTPLPVGSIPQMPHLTLNHPLPPSSISMNSVLPNMELTKDGSKVNATAGDATPTEEDGTSVSSPSTTSIMDASTGVVPTFNQVMAHQMSRPMLPVLPPVSSAGTPIPFPPPHVSFGFPPPPLRPGLPNAGMPGSFPWMPKPGFPSFPDSEMRFATPINTTVLNIRHPGPNQSLHAVSPLNPTGLEIQRPQTEHKSNTPQKDKANSDKESPKKFGGRPGSNTDMFAHQGGSSPKSYENDYDMVVENQDESAPPDFSREVDAGMIPRFPGPPDFHMARGMIRAPWMHGPGPRFPHNIHPGSPFPPRAGGPMPPRMDMDFFRHQGPPGHIMHMAGPPPQQPQWGNNGFPPRNQDRYQNRRDYYENSRYDDDREKRYNSRDDQSHSRDHREDDYRSTTEEKDQKAESEKKDLDSKSSVCDKPKDQSKPEVKRDPNAKACLSSKSTKPIDFAADMFRLQSYGNRSKKPRVKPPPKVKQTEQSPKPCTTNPNETADPIIKNDVIIPAEETAEKKVEEPVLENTNTDDNCSTPVESASESRSKKERADRKRSRWGRTLSQEREFQQQRINEIEMKFQSYESEFQALPDSMNGSDSIENVSSDIPIVDIPPDTPNSNPAVLESNEDLPVTNFIENLPVTNNENLPVTNNENLTVLNDEVHSPVTKTSSDLTVPQESVVWPVEDKVAPNSMDSELFPASIDSQIFPASIDSQIFPASIDSEILSVSKDPVERDFEPNNNTSIIDTSLQLCSANEMIEDTNSESDPAIPDSVVDSSQTETMVVS